MSPLTQLIGFGLRQVIGDYADGVVQIGLVVEQHFRDHSRALPKALDQAHHRAWQALGVALAGDGLLDRVKVFFASGDDKGVREQVQLFLAGNAVSFDGAPADFRRDCLDELKRLRKSGLLSPAAGSSAEIARQAAGFRRHADQQGLIEESRRAVAGVADALAEGYPKLSRLLRTPTPAGPPLLAAAFCYFFRREVETDDELAHGLFFDGLRQLSASQAKAFGEVGKALAALGGQFDALFEQLDRVEAAVVETHAVAVETHGAVLDVQAELQRLGGLHLANAGEVRTLFEQVLLHLAQAGMARGEVRPGNSCSIRGEDERRAVKALLARFRELPAEEQRQAPALLNGLGKLQVGAGDFAEARQTFTEVVQVVGDPSGKAEASFNAYRAALEEKKWDAALAALREAATQDPQRFAPFPLHRYEPKRILGAGGFGTAILCHDRNFDENVVVKTLHAADLARGVDEVFREARILHRLSHPAIIGVRDCEYADPNYKARPYLVMDHFPGGTLQQFLEQRGPLNLEHLLVVAVQVAEGMRAAHAQGVLHRDLKPANLLVRKEGDRWQVKIIDFGLALRQQTVETSKVRSGATHKSTLDSSVAGTLDYAPPEQQGKLPGVQPGPYSDAYAFARTCCYAIFGTPHPVPRQWRGLPDERLGHLLEACIEEQPAKRPSDFDKVLRRLGEARPTRALQTPLQSQESQVEDPVLQEMARLSSIGKDSKDYLKTIAPNRIDAWRAAANCGSSEGQHLLGLCLLIGAGIQADPSEGVHWLRKSAEQGYGRAQHSFGVCCYTGQGGEKDDAKALQWFRKAAEQGHASAQYNLGLMHSNGRGVPKDEAAAAQWFRKAAEQGFAQAQYNLGVMYLKGRGVPTDEAAAVQWFRKAAEQGFAQAQWTLGVLCASGQGLPRDDAAAVRWYSKAAGQGLPVAQSNLGRMYANGWGVPKDEVAAIQWYSQAADQGLADAQYNLGVMYSNGRGVPTDKTAAVQWYRKAAEQGFAQAQYSLGWMYENGRGVPKDEAAAVQWYRKAAEQGLADAQNNLGLMHKSGRGVPEDETEAVQWFRKAAGQGDANAQYNLGLCFLKGQGVTQEEREAIQNLRSAAGQKHVLAQYELGNVYETGQGILIDQVEALSW